MTQHRPLVTPEEVKAFRVTKPFGSPTAEELLPYLPSTEEVRELRRVAREPSMFQRTKNWMEASTKAFVQSFQPGPEGFGMSEERMRNLGLISEDGGGPLDVVNRALTKPVTAAGDVAARFFSGLVNSLVAGESQIMRDHGASDIEIENLRKRMMGLPFGAIEATFGFGALRNIPKGPKGVPPGIRLFTKDDWRNLDAVFDEVAKTPTMAASMKVAARDTEKRFVAGEGVRRTIEPTVREEGTPIAFRQLSKKQKAAATEFFSEAGVKVKDSHNPRNSLITVFLRKKLTDKQVDLIMAKHNLTLADMAEILGMDRNRARRLLPSAKALQRRYDALRFAIEKDGDTASLKAMDEVLKEDSVDVLGAAMNGFMDTSKRFSNRMRGLFVTQPKTAIRNAWTAVGHVNMSIANDAFELALQRLVLGPGYSLVGKQYQLTPYNAFFQTLRFAARPTMKGDRKANAKLVDDFFSGLKQARKETIVKERAEKKAKLSGRALERAEQAEQKAIGKAQQKVVDLEQELFFRLFGEAILAEAKVDKAIKTMNIFNRIQEGGFRRLRFAAVMDRDLKEKGVKNGIIEAVEKNLLEQVDDKIVGAAVESALTFTYAANPRSTFAKELVRFVSNLPGGVFIEPFPRFIANATREIYEYSPLAAYKLLSQQERRLLGSAGGETRVQVFSKILTGQVMLGVALQVRHTALPGDKWYEYHGANLLPFFPLVVPLFIVDFLDRKRKGTLSPDFGIKDLRRALVGQPGRIDLQFMEQIIDAVTEFTGAGGAAGEKAGRRSKEALGKMLAGIATPLQAVSDFVDAFRGSPLMSDIFGFEEVDAPIQRDVRGSILAPAVERVGGLTAPVLKAFGKRDLREALPERRLITRPGSLRRMNPAESQITGFTQFEPKRFIQSELDRLGFKKREILAGTGNLQADRLLERLMSETLERRLLPKLRTRAYRLGKPAEQAEIIRLAMQPIRDDVREKARRIEPELFKRLDLLREPKRMQRDKAVNAAKQRRRQRLGL